LKDIFSSFAEAAAQGPTLVIVRSTDGFTFGGYAAAAWEEGGGEEWAGGHFIPAAGSFLFWVENPQGRAPGCLDCANPARALYERNSVYGPTFACDSCLYLCEEDNPAASCAKPTATYPDTTGLGVVLFTGAQQFMVEDYEVWAVT